MGQSCSGVRVQIQYKTLHLMNTALYDMQIPTVERIMETHVLAIKWGGARLTENQKVKDGIPAA